MTVFAEEEIHSNLILCLITKKYFVLFFPQILGKVYRETHAINTVPEYVFFFFFVNWNSSILIDTCEIF